MPIMKLSDVIAEMEKGNAVTINYTDSKETAQEWTYYDLDEVLRCKPCDNPDGEKGVRYLDVKEIERVQKVVITAYMPFGEATKQRIKWGTFHAIRNVVSVEAAD